MDNQNPVEEPLAPQPQPTPAPQSSSKLPVLLAFTAILLLAGLGGGYYFMNQSQTPPVTPTPTEAASTPTPTTTSTSTLQAGGSSFRDSKGVFNLLYPNDYKTDSENNGQYNRFYKAGKTQKGQTEMYDGVIIVMESVDLKGQTLDAYVKAMIKTQTEGGTVEIIAPQKAITIHNYPGFTYQTRGIGEAIYYVIQKDSSSDFAVIITTLVADPENVGYQKEVDSIFSTITLEK